MAGQNNNTYRLLWMLGLAITLPMILMAGPVAGYFVSWVLIHQLGAPEILTPILMAMGLVGSGLQAYRLIQRLNQQQQRKHRN